MTKGMKTMRQRTRLLWAATLAAGWLASPRSTSGAPAAPPAPAPTTAAPAAAPVIVAVTNPLAAARLSETLAIARAELVAIAPSFELKTAEVVDASGRPVLSQLVDLDGDTEPDQLVFQTDLAAGQS
jgi:hypothetical protein